MARIRLRSIKLLLLGLLGVQAFAPVRNSPKQGRHTHSQRQQLQQQCPVRQRGTELYFLGTDGGILGVGAPEVVSSNFVSVVSLTVGWTF